jgi:tetratricopeptide (TPR) repeat protein
LTRYRRHTKGEGTLDRQPRLGSLSHPLPDADIPKRQGRLGELARVRARVLDPSRNPRFTPCFAAAALTLLLSACSPVGVEGPSTSLNVEDPASDKYFPSNEPYKAGAEHFNRGQYGLAERYFRDAVEKAPGDGLAWVALASSYDRLSRFDLADRAYAKAISISGETVQILNNQGYSQVLRGNLKAARAKFMRAAELEPGNITVANNIKLLEGGQAVAR